MNEVVSAIGTQRDLWVVRGTTQSLIFTLKEKGADDVTFVACDLTSETVKFTARTSLNGTIVFEKTNEPGDHVDPTAGKTMFQVERTDLATLPTREYVTLVYEVRRITDASPAGHYVHAHGNLVVKLTAQPLSTT